MKNSRIKSLIYYCLQNFGQFKVLTSTVERPESSIQSSASRVQYPASNASSKWSILVRSNYSLLSELIFSPSV